MIFKIDLSEVFIYIYNNNEIEQFYYLKSPLCPEVTKISTPLGDQLL
jgi:hypothetical protein